MKPKENAEGPPDALGCSADELFDAAKRRLKDHVNQNRKMSRELKKNGVVTAQLASYRKGCADGYLHAIIVLEDLREQVKQNQHRVTERL